MISADGGITHYAKAYKLFAIIRLHQAVFVYQKKENMLVLNSFL